MQKYLGVLTPMNFHLIGVEQDHGSKYFNCWGDGLEGGGNICPLTSSRYLYDQKRDKIWTAIIATRQWFTKLVTSEADALVDDFGNNPPPEIGTQSYSGDTHDKGD